MLQATRWCRASGWRTCWSRRAAAAHAAGAPGAGDGGAAGGVAVLVVAVDLTPAACATVRRLQRLNSALSLALGYNGLGRITWRSRSRAAAPAPGRPDIDLQVGAGLAPGIGNQGLLRLLARTLAGQASWLLMFSLLGLFAERSRCSAVAVRGLATEDGADPSFAERTGGGGQRSRSPRGRLAAGVGSDLQFRALLSHLLPDHARTRRRGPGGRRRGPTVAAVP